MSVRIDSREQLDEWKKGFDTQSPGIRLFSMYDLVCSFPAKGESLKPHDHLAFEAYEYGMRFCTGWNAELKKRHKSIIPSVVASSSAKLGVVSSMDELNEWICHNTNLLCTAYNTSVDFVGLYPEDKFELDHKGDAPVGQYYSASRLDDVYSGIRYNQAKLSRVLGKPGLSERLWVLIAHEVAHRVQDKVRHQEGYSVAEDWLTIDWKARESAFSETSSLYVYTNALCEKDSHDAEEVALQAVVRAKNGMEVFGRRPEGFWELYEKSESDIYDLNEILKLSQKEYAATSENPARPMPIE